MKLKVISGICLVIIALFFSCQSDESIEFTRYYAEGSLVYQSHCQNCHGAKGEGLAALIPPLTDSVYLKSNKTILACIIKKGIKGKLSISGRQFEGQMPATGLSPIEIAQVVTYITNSFGNKQGLTNDDTAQADLNNCK